jgi:nucleoside-diphosphate-sugar epimerase
MHILISGGAGYIGSGAVAHFLKSGHTVRALDRLLFGDQGLAEFKNNSRFSLQTGDVRNAADVEGALDGVDAVIHLAALVGEAACNAVPEAATAINRDAALDMLKCAAKMRVKRMLFISTCSNYGVSETGALADESAPLNPLTHYARTKVEAEQAILQSDDPVCVTVLRSGTIFGVSGRTRFDLLINEMARDLALKRPIKIYKPEAWRPWLHVDDAAQAFDKLLNAGTDKIDRQIFNVVGENLQKTHLLEFAKKAVPSADLQVVEGVPDNRDYRISAKKLETLTGFTPKNGVETAMREMKELVANGFFRDPFSADHRSDLNEAHIKLLQNP